MNKLKRYKIYAFTNADVESNHIISDTAVDLKAREVRLTESILIKAFKRYKNEEFIENEVDTDLIKIMLSSDKEIATKQCESLKLKNKEYVAWFSTPGMMKKEDRDSNSKCEMFFINKEYKDFISEFENLISLGKIEDFYGTDRVINKDLSRIALATSSAHETKLVPKIIILPECSHSITSNIVTIEGDEVVEKVNHTINNLTIFDGCGVMSMEFAEKIKQGMSGEHDISLAGIRLYGGLAVKGLVTSVDFSTYFKEFYTANTNYFKKENSKFYIKDMYHNWQCTENVDMILNESQCKWAGNFKSMQEVYSLLDNDEFKEYKDLLSHLWITKINKADEDIKEYTRSNYQLLANLAITEKEINNLSAETERIYKEIINGNEDMIRIYWGDIIKECKVDDEGNAIIEDDLSMSTKAQELLTFNPDFIKLGYVKKAVGRVVTKKIKELAAGKFYIKGDYKTLTQDPITYLDWIMNRTSNQLAERRNGLDANKFYCSSINKGEIRTVSRNPLNSFSEILNVVHDRNYVIDKYLGHFSKEIYVFNCYDLTPQVMSGCDFDLDIAFVVDDEIIRNSVVEDLPFINLDDVNAKPKKMKFTYANRIDATLEASGDLIGSLALNGAGVSNLATYAGYRMYANKTTGELRDYDSLLSSYFATEKIQEVDKGFDDFQMRLAERFNYVEDYYTEKEIKEQIREGLYLYRKESYELRNLQMTAIDTPKTLIKAEVPKELKFKRPRYLKYVKDYLNNKTTKNISNALNLHATRVARELLKEDIKLIKSSDNLRLLNKYLYFNDYALDNKEEYEECKQEIGDLYDTYKSKKGVNKYYNDKSKDARDEDEKQQVAKERLREMLKIEAEIMLVADQIIEKYDNRIISHSLAMLECSESFIFNFFYAVVATILKESCIGLDNITYEESESGDIIYLFKKYRKVMINRDSNIEKLHNENRKRIKEKLNKLDNNFEHKVRVCITNKEIDFNRLDKATIGTQFYKNKVQPILINNGKNIGFIFPEFNQIDDFRNVTDFENEEVDVEVIEVNHKSATLMLIA